MHMRMAMAGFGAALLLAGCVRKESGEASCTGQCRPGIVELRKRMTALEARVSALEGKAPAASAPAAAAAAATAAPAAAAGLPSIGVPNPRKNQWACVKVEKGPAVDGNLDDAAWKKAVQVQLVSDTAGKRLANESTVLICRDAENFYIGAVCMESEMAHLKISCTKRDDKVYGDDCVEFYLDTGNKAEAATKLVVNPDGVFADFLRGPRGDITPNYSEYTWGVQIKTSKLADRYVLEIAVPLKDMKLEDKAGTTFGFNALRFRQKRNKSDGLFEASTWWGECNHIGTLGKVVFE